jgi:hypothetical protein
MSTKGKVKVYKNPARNKPDAFKPYIPQYQIKGVEPQEYKSPLAPGYHTEVAKPSTDNPRQPRPVIRQPYAEAVPSPIGRGRGLLPNVGNNMEQTWSSVDGEIVDDLTEAPQEDESLVDNNEYVTNEALGLPPDAPLVVEYDEPEEEAPEEIEYSTELGSLLYQSLLHMEDGNYLLLIKGQIVEAGTLEHIQEVTRALVFGEHAEYEGNPVPVDDILVIKKAKIEVGVFLE